MEVSGKKRKAITRSYPGRSIDEIAREQGLSPRVVKKVLREAGKLEPFPAGKIAAAVFMAATVAALAAAGYHLATRPYYSRLASRKADMNALLVTIDTCRADHLGAYGYKKGATPNLDRLAQEGVVFENAFALQPITLPSHSTIMTGMHPAAHGVLDNGLFKLPPGARTIAEIERDKGRQTGAVVASFVLNSRFGLDRGFDTYDDDLVEKINSSSSSFDEILASAVSDRALEWIGGRKSSRWFLWLHYFDPHAPYNPPARHERPGMSSYDGEIAFVDAELGRVLSFLEESGLRDNTLVMVVGDHGEGLGEHGEETHGYFLYDSTTRVPMILSMPGSIPAGLRIKERVTLMDAAPTIADATGTGEGESFQGRSLLPLVFGREDGPERGSIISMTHLPWYQHGWSPSYSIRKDDVKYIMSPRPELYDQGKDPAETNDLIEGEKGLAEAMKRELKKELIELGEEKLGDGRLALDEEAREKLAALGYISTAGVKRDDETEDAPDVKDMIKVLSLMKDAWTYKSKGDFVSATRAMERVVAMDPGNRRALLEMGRWKTDLKDYGGAEKALRDLIALDPEYSDAYYELGRALANAGGLEEAESIIKAQLDQDPLFAKSQNLMGFILFQQKRYGESVPYFEEAIRLYPTFNEAMANLAASHASMGNYKAALKYYDMALKIRPDSERYKSLRDMAAKDAAR